MKSAARCKSYSSSRASSSDPAITRASESVATAMPTPLNFKPSLICAESGPSSMMLLAPTTSWGERLGSWQEALTMVR